MAALDVLMAFEQALGEPDWEDRVRDLCTRDCEFVDVGPGEITDIERFIKSERTMTAWSDGRPIKWLQSVTSTTR